MSDKLITRDAFVIYVPNRGYMKNKAGEFHTEFAHARLFPREKAANDSISMNRKFKRIAKDDPAFVIPVEMTLDPRKVFKAVLRGKV